MWSSWEAAPAASPASVNWPNQASPSGRSSATARAAPPTARNATDRSSPDAQLVEHLQARAPLPQARRSSAARHPRTVHAQRRRLVRSPVRDRCRQGAARLRRCTAPRQRAHHTTLAPKAAHVASSFCQHFSYKLAGGRDWHQERARATDLIFATVESYAPN